MTKEKKLSEVPILDDEALGDFWEKNEPEEFGDWGEGSLDFRRPLKKLIQSRLAPGDVRIIDLENYRSSRPAIQIVMSQDTKKDDGCRPVRVTGRQVRFRIKGQAILPIDPDGPGGWIVYNALQMQTGVQGISFQQPQSLDQLLLGCRVGAKGLRVLKKLPTRFQDWHFSYPVEARAAFSSFRFFGPR